MKYAGRLLRVRNLEKYQHYKDRNPPWIKLHQETLEDYDFGELPDALKYHALAIMLLASRTDNSLPDDAAWIGRKINAKSKVDLSALVSAGFLEVYQNASETLADSLQDALPEGEGEKRERREEGEKRRGACALPPLPPALDTPEMRTAWSERLQERSEIGAKGRQTPAQVSSQFRQLERVAAARGVQAAVACVERATAGHHQGVVFPDDLNGGAHGRPARQNPRSAHPASSPDRLAKLRERDRLALLPREEDPAGAKPG